MSDQARYLRMNNDDEYAARVLSLAVKFFGAHLPLASQTLAAEIYPGLGEAAFRKQFLRDRELLGSLGIIIREAESDERGALWAIDREASYAEGEGIAASDARLLYVLCHDMGYDQAFPYRDELRLALAKISRMYRGTTVSLSDASTSRERRMLARLMSCMSAHVAVRVAYTDARGIPSERTLALLGSFGLRDHTYFLASEMDAHGTLASGEVRTYRLDRFDRVDIARPTRSYEIPADFSVRDYERLPFQIGDIIGTAQLQVPPHPERELARATTTHGVLEGSVWEVPYSNLDLLASWSYAVYATPLAPQELVDAWIRIGTQTRSSDPYDPQLAAYSPVHKARRGSRPGRTGGSIAVRQLMALASSLTQQGDVITAEQVAQTLGIGVDEARHLIFLLTMGSSVSGEYLPVIPDEDYDEVSLMEGARLAAPRVRLTRSETTALLAALAELGVPDDDPLVRTLATSFAAPQTDVRKTLSTLEAPSSTREVHTLITCAKAIADDKSLSFAYVPVAGGDQTERHVVPQLLRRSDDSWYLDAYDEDRQAQRVFRVDRMSHLQVGATSEARGPHTKKEHPVTVFVRFDDTRYVDLFAWDDAEVLERTDDSVVVRMPRYGGTWLPRHLAACAGTVHVSDRDLAECILACSKTV